MCNGLATLLLLKPLSHANLCGSAVKLSVQKRGSRSPDQQDVIPVSPKNQQQQQRSQSIAHLHHSIAKVSISALLSLSSSLCYCFYFYSSLFVVTISWFPLPDCKKRLSGDGQLLFSVFQDKED